MLSNLFKKTYTADQFWNWFESSKSKFSNILHEDRGRQEKLLDELTDHLHRYCDKLFAQLGGSPGGPLELIITAEGDVHYFDKVRELVDRAPKMDKWEIIAFMPPMSIEGEFEYEEIILNPEDVRFAPMLNSNAPGSIGIRVYIPHYKIQEESDWLEPAVHKMVELVLGEKTYAEEIAQISIGQLNEAEKNELMKMDELPRYVLSRKTGLPQ